MAVYSTFFVFVFEIPALSVVKDEKRATGMFDFCFEKKNVTKVL